MEITTDQLKELVTEASKTGAESAVRAINTPDPAERPGGTAPSIVRKRPARLSLTKAINAMREGTWKGAELERDFSDATRSLFPAKDSENGTFHVPTTPIAYASVVEAADLPTEDRPALRAWLSATRDASEAQTVSISGDTAGGALVAPAFLQNEFVLSLQSAVAFRNAPGVDTIPVNTNIAYFPRESAIPAGGAYAEASLISGSDATFARQQVLIQKQAVLNQFSNELLADATPAYEQYLARTLARSLALTQDFQYLNGDGQAPNVYGIAAYATANETTAPSGTYSGSWSASGALDKLISAIGDLRNANVEPNAIITHPMVLTAMSKNKDLANRYLLQSVGGVFGAPVAVPNAGALSSQSGYAVGPWRATVMGIPVLLSTQVPVVSGSPDSTSLILGDFNFAKVVERQALELAVSPHIGFTYDQTAVRVIARSAIVLTQPTAFMVIDGIEA